MSEDQRHEVERDEKNYIEDQQRRQQQREQQQEQHEGAYNRTTDFYENYDDEEDVDVTDEDVPDAALTERDPVLRVKKTGKHAPDDDESQYFSSLLHSRGLPR